MTISSRAGHPPTSELPALNEYSQAELERASTWPAIARYLHIVRRPDPTDPRDLLRKRRHESWLRCAIATFFDRASAESVCTFWSRRAEELIAEAWHASGCDRAGLGLLALGKLGAVELNLSSDVDLIVVRGDDVAPDMKSFRAFQSILSDTTEFGFCLRTDFTLRPGGRASTAQPTMTEFEYHYGYHGEMWERLAYVRMRVLHGPDQLSKAVTAFARKFSFRRHLDYTLIDELKSLRTKIRSEKYELRPGHFQLKLGEGGIREIELFVHALQVLHGGRNVHLQTHSTNAALEQIESAGLLPAEECRDLKEAYWYLRRLENRLQAFEDQQTYSLDLEKGNPAIDEDFRDVLDAHRKRAISIATSLFGESPIVVDFPAGLEDQKAWLTAKGFSETSANETWPALVNATALSRRSEADERARLDFLRGFAIKLGEVSLDRDLGLSLLLDFVKAVRAKASFFTLLNREPRVRDELADLFSISPYLGSILTSRPELIDEFIYRKQADPSPDFNVLLEELAERRLLSELISASQFLGDRDLRKMTMNLTANADAITQILLERLREDLKGGEISLVALGKWGGRELGLRSDLDFIFVTPGAPSQEDQKVAKRFLSRLSEPHRGGSIYSVDMRLRPSGHSGPIMVPKMGLEKYLRESAAAWERQAYLRARPLCELHFHPGKVAAARGLSPADRDELRMIREKLFGAAQPGDLDLKLSVGGLADVEFTAQIALLARGEFSLDPSTSGMIQYLESIDAKWKSVGSSLRREYETLRGIEQLYQLTTSQSGSKMRLKSDEFKRLALTLGSSAVDLEAMIRNVFDTIRATLREIGDLER